VSNAGVRAIFHSEEEAAAVADRLRSDGFEAAVAREPFAGEDDDEDHPWAVTTDAPEVVMDVLAELYDGWLDVDAPGPAVPPLDLPAGPRRVKGPSPTSGHDDVRPRAIE
jgi:hypothetical protein